ncbi:MAG: hypothetical protein AAF585_14675 [Verrucomicrobiota bacterium]
MDTDAKGGLSKICWLIYSFLSFPIAALGFIILCLFVFTAALQGFDSKGKHDWDPPRAMFLLICFAFNYWISLGIRATRLGRKWSWLLFATPIPWLLALVFSFDFSPSYSSGVIPDKTESIITASYCVVLMIPLGIGFWAESRSRWL